MIRAVAQTALGRPVVYMGLDDESIALLIDGRPIHVSLDTFVPKAELPPGVDHVNLPDVDVVVFHATKEAVAEMRAAFERNRSRPAGEPSDDDV